MVRCIVKSCKNNSAQFHKEHVSFLKLPSNDILREGWFQKIGEVKLPPKIDTARICSVHFTEDCFVQGRTRKSSAQRRYLRPTAVPTLNLGPTQNRVEEIFELKSIERQFPIPVSNCGMTEREGCNVDEEQITGPNDNDPQFPATIETVTKPGPSNCHSRSFSPYELDSPNSISKTPKKLSERNPWLENINRVCRTPLTTSTELDSRGDRIFPIRSQRLKAVRRIVLPKCSKQLKSDSNSRKSNKVSVHNDSQDCVSEENSPPWKCRERFLEEYVDESVHGTKRSMNHDDPYVQMEWLKAEVQYFRSLSEFHANSKRTDLITLSNNEDDCQALRNELERKKEEIRHLLAENKALQALVKDLHAKLNAAEMEKKEMEMANNEKVVQVLQPYFTEG